MRHLFYLIGMPGAGKTTLLSAALDPLDGIVADKPVPHIGFRDGSVAWLGRRRPPFGGTDAMHMAIQPKVLAWMKSPTAPTYVIGEGDRLGNRKFLQEASVAGYWVQVAWLDTPGDLAQERRIQRSGVRQNDAWVAGRITKVARLVDFYKDREGFIVLNGAKPVEELAAAIRGLPAFEWAAAGAPTV